MDSITSRTGFVHNKVDMIATGIKMIPPEDGVPSFVLWVSGTSSEILS